jgi:hypothetical protein
VNDRALLAYIKKIRDSENILYSEKMSYSKKISLKEINAKSLFFKRQKAHIDLIHAHRNLKGLFKELIKENQYKEELLRLYLNSFSWKITSPMRSVINKIRALKRNLIG